MKKERKNADKKISAYERERKILYTEHNYEKHQTN